MKLDKNEFFKEFNITEKAFKECGIHWEELVKIYNSYTAMIPSLEKEASDIVSKLIDSDRVHSVRRRVKKPKHLLEKIIRKGKKYQELGLNSDNYTEVITDLIGVRILHLFKDDWQIIHKKITDLWEMVETPQVNIRRGDYNLELFHESIKDLECEIVIRDHGYRSVHYLLSIPVTQERSIHVEIQVRTVFEEAWSEIDHEIRYPYYKDDPILIEYLGIFNRLVGSADEMGTFIKKMKDTFLNKSRYPRISKNFDNKYK